MKKLKSKELKPLEVTVDGGSIERAISILKRRMATEGVLKTLKKKRYNLKPSIENKIKSQEAEKKRRKERKMRRK